MSRPLLRWRDLYDETELYRAAILLYTKPVFRWRKALLSSTDGRTFYDFARKGLRNLHRLHRALAARRFEPRPGLALHKNFNGRQRTLYLFPWEERLVDVLLYRSLNRALDDWFSRCSYAYRLHGFGVDRCQREIRRCVERGGGRLFLVKRDIASFFATIDHELLLAKLRVLIAADDYAMELLIRRIRFRYRDRDGDGDAIRTAKRGAPFGTAIACLLANVYLTDLDRALERQPGVRFFRYADDMLVLAGDPERAGAAATALATELEALHLRSKPSHALDLELTTGPETSSRFAPERRVRHLGLEFRADGSVGLSRDKGRKIRNLFRYAFRRQRRRLRRLADPRQRARLAIAIANETLDRGVRNVAIIDYYLRHVTDEAQLALLDRWLAEEVLHLAFGNGHKKGHFRKLPYRDLRAMGLPSLLHRRRLILHGKIESLFFLWQARRERRRERRPRGATRRGGCQTGSPVFSRSPEAAADSTS